ncbi:DUF2059 domain-containing protein [Sphingomonas sp.]|uniref:DUF2059 domain-containing protein n=1 Tax=Sphingomonas sp. TaxID=28214 RepID=UPI001B20E9F0|nr:DUF2059 domain-containing protein [Sphingomonas sp.]MBO9712430.1 DUF2059 domain-containing protein [Sphingomonas sp.]
MKLAFRVGFVLAGAAVLALSPASALAQTTLAPTPAPAAAPVADPAKLAVARQIAVKVFPLGSYKRMFGDGFGKMMDGMADSFAEMPISTLSQIAGLSQDDVKDLGDAKIGEAMSIYDPHWRDRMKLGTSSVFKLVAELMGEFEPRIQEALARAYAHNFTLDQLNELLAFFNTPTGALYADRSMLMFMDPEVMKESQALVPELMKKMPEIMKDVQEEQASLPPPRRIQDLSPEDRKKLAGLLGVKVENLDDPKTE